MGLDMYFELRKSKWTAHGVYDKGKRDTTRYPKDLKKLGDYIKKWNFKSHATEDYYQVGYFRKFNALHSYIVNMYADGEDNCQKIFLSKDKANDILSVLKRVNEDHNLAEELLPTQSGFFFGDTQYDEYYFEDIKDGIKFFELLLENTDFTKYDLIYQASW